MTPEQYLKIERQAEWKHEHFEGEMCAMPVADEPHCLVSGDALGELHHMLRRACTAYSGNMRILVSPSGFYTYPDVTIVCGKAEFLRSKTDPVLNHIVIISIESDRGLRSRPQI